MVVFDHWFEVPGARYKVQGTRCTAQVAKVQARRKVPDCILVVAWSQAAALLLAKTGTKVLSGHPCSSLVSQNPS